MDKYIIRHLLNPTHRTFCVSLFIFQKSQGNLRWKFFGNFIVIKHSVRLVKEGQEHGKLNKRSLVGIPIAKILFLAF